MKAPFTQEQVDALNRHQNDGQFHPFTCRYDGDEKHIQYEFQKDHPNDNYDEYIIDQKSQGSRFPEMAFNQTNLLATSQGWVCPVCGYKQDWAHDFML